MHNKASKARRNAVATQVATIEIKETIAIKLDRVTPDRQQLQRIEVQCLPDRAMIEAVVLVPIDLVAVVTTEVAQIAAEIAEAVTTAVVVLREEITIAIAPETTPGLRIKVLAGQPEWNRQNRLRRLPMRCKQAKNPSVLSPTCCNS